MFEKDFLEVLDRELVIALGCTEPIAIAFASAMASKHLMGELVSLEVYASANIIKNAMGVIIPGTGKTGMNLAAALGSLSDSDKNLEVLCGLKDEDIQKAMKMIEEGKIHVRKSDHPKKLYIEVIAKSENSSSRVIIEDRHTNITRIETDGRVFFSVEDKIDELPVNDTSFMNMERIWTFVQNVDIKKLTKVEESIKVNKLIGDEGIRHDYGLRVGKTIFESMRNGHQVIDPTNYAMALTAAGSDARMAGSSLNVMSNSGSGNQGITATLPVIAYWEKLGLSYEDLLRATTLSHLVTIYIKTKFGRLSALCGATIAATGASCGITYLQGGKKEDIYASVQNMLGNVTGILCDGAKGGCALKVATCTSAACLSSSLALNGIAIGSHDGIIDHDPEKTINNLCLLSTDGSLESDRIILDIMLEKENNLLKS